MNLTTEEYKLIETRMLDLKITYEEIYYELFDHIASDIEHKRQGGDSRDVNTILTEIVDVELGGPAGIKQMARNQETRYRLKIYRQIWKDQRSQLWWKILISVFFSVLMSRLIFLRYEANFALGVYLVAVLIIVSMEVFVIFKMRELKNNGQGQSLLRTTITWQVLLPTSLLTMVMTVLNLISNFSHFNPIRYIGINPFIPLLILCLTGDYIESCYKVMKAGMPAFQTKGIKPTSPNHIEQL